MFFLNSWNHPPRLVQNTYSTDRLEDREGVPLLSALPSLQRDTMGKVGKGMCQWPNRAPMGRTLFCRRARERIWLGKGPITLLGGFFWPGNTLIYITPV